MELLAYTDVDMALTAALETDPSVMRDLGGALRPDEIPALHQRRAAPSTDWWLKIVPEPGGPAVGTIGIWDATWDGEAIHETGWLVLSAHQGKGLATQALGLLLTRAVDEPRFRELHAFPATRNGASNALCRRFGFSVLEEVDHEYRGQALHCNHCVLDLSLLA